MSENKIFPWQKSGWKALLAQPHLPHAMLFVGPAGTGKGVFAEQLAARLLCETASLDEAACGACQGCHLLANGSHPDYRKITLESESDEEGSEEAKPSAKSKKATAPATQIKIDQIRALDEFVYVGSHRQGHLVIVIDPADAMNVAATNALLKILEEPPSSVYFLLVSSNPKRLLATLRSRCRQFPFSIPEAALASAWLKAQGVQGPERLLALTGGAPLQALAMQYEGGVEVVEEVIGALHRPPLEPIAVAAHWEALRKKHPAFRLEHLVDAVQKWLYDLARVQGGNAPRYLPGWRQELHALAQNASATRLNRCYSDLLKIRATARHPLNELLFLEDMAARCIAALSLPKPR